MNCSATNAEILSEAIISNMTKAVDYATIPINGSKEAAKIIESLLTTQHI